MALGRLIDDNYSPEEIDIMTCAFNAAMRSLKVRDHGSPQGSAISPLLVNLFMHYAFDAWMARTYPAVTFE